MIISLGVSQTDPVRLRVCDKSYGDMVYRDYMHESAFRWAIRYILNHLVKNLDDSQLVNVFINYTNDEDLLKLHAVIWRKCSRSKSHGIIIRESISNYFNGDVFGAFTKLKKLLEELIGGATGKFISFDAIIALAESGNGWIRSV